MDYIVFIIIWIVTFLPAWYLLLKLIAFAGSKKSLLSLNFLAIFVIYQTVIALPYLYLLILGDESVPGIVKLIAYSAILIGIVISAVRFFLTDQVNSLLWNLYGRVYDGLLGFYPYSKLQSQVAELVDPNSSMEILDLGCGSGNQTMLLYESNARITAVDNSSSMLKQFKKKSAKNNIKNVEIIHQDLQDFISRGKNMYNKIVLVNVLYTVQDRDLLFKELLRSLKPNGEIVITNSDRAGNRTLISEHIKNRSFISLLRPKLICVFIIDGLISELSKTGHFSFVSADQIEKEVNQAGGKYHFIARCYGDVNILFKVTKN